MEVIENWVVNFSSVANEMVYGTTPLSNLKLVDSDDSIKFKVTAVLLDISNSLIRGKMDEEMLDLLEILDKLLLQEHMVIMSSLKFTDFWTAVECTCRFMWPVRASDGFFGDVLDRIWKKRIGMLKERESDLVTPELLNWESDLNKAFEEPEIYQKIRETNIRYNAISHLIQLLEVHWTPLGCSSPELESGKRFLKREDPPNNGICRADNAVDKVNEELGIDEKEGRDRSNIEKANDVEELGGVENYDGTEKVNEQEHEHEPSHNKGDETIAQEIKIFLLEIQRLVDHSTRQEQESNKAVGKSADVTLQPDVANGTETGGYQDYNEAENSEGTSSSESVRPHLLTPEPLNVVTPLSILKAPRPRRPMKFWTPEEVEALRRSQSVW